MKRILTDFSSNCLYTITYNSLKTVGGARPPINVAPTALFFPFGGRAMAAEKLISRNNPLCIMGDHIDPRNYVYLRAYTYVLTYIPNTYIHTKINFN